MTYEAYLRQMQAKLPSSGLPWMPNSGVPVTPPQLGLAQGP